MENYIHQLALLKKVYATDQYVLETSGLTGERKHKTGSLKAREKIIKEKCKTCTTPSAIPINLLQFTNSAPLFLNMSSLLLYSFSLPALLYQFPLGRGSLVWWNWWVFQVFADGLMASSHYVGLTASQWQEAWVEFLLSSSRSRLCALLAFKRLIYGILGSPLEFWSSPEADTGMWRTRIKIAPSAQIKSSVGGFGSGLPTHQWQVQLENDRLLLGDPARGAFLMTKNKWNTFSTQSRQS